MVTCRNTKLLMNEGSNTAISYMETCLMHGSLSWGKGFKCISHLTQKTAITLLKLGNELITGRY